MQRLSFYIWTLVHLIVAIAVSMTAPFIITLIVIAVLLSAQIAVYFNAHLDEGVFEEMTLGGLPSLLRTYYSLGSLVILVLSGVGIFLLITAR